MTLQKRYIADNVRLSRIHTNKFKTETVAFSLTLPLTRRAYLLGLLLSGVMRRGSESFPSMALLNKRLDELYASTVEINSTTCAGTLSLNVSAEMIDGRFALDGTDISGGVIEVIADILLRPLRSGNAFPSDTVASEIAFVKDALLAEKNNTRSYAATRLRELLGRANPERPTLEYLLGEIDSITPEELYDHYLRLLSSAPLNVFYVGAEDTDSIAEKILRAFSQFVGHSFTPVPVRLPDKPLEFISVTEDMPVSQGKLALGLRTGAGLGNGQHTTAIVLNELLGASPASKLFLNVRERLGLCYYCSSSYSPFSGNLTVSSGIDSRKLEVVTEEIMRQLDEIKKGNISDTEFTAARKSLEYSYVQIYDSPFSLQGFYSGRDTVGCDETVEECKQKILAVTAEEVCQLAGNVVWDTRFFINGTQTQDGGEEEADNE